MTEFHHHPDGLIYVRVSRGLYAADARQFADDIQALGLPAYGGLPEGFRERRYLPGRLHALFTEDSQQGAPAHWPEGDSYLAAAEALLSRQAARTP